LNLLREVLKGREFRADDLLFLGGGGGSRLLVGGGGHVRGTLALVALSHEVLVVHAALNDEQTGGYERLFEKLALEHLDQVLDADIRFLFAAWGLDHRLTTGCLLLLQRKQLLLLLDAHLVALFEGELRVLAVDALRIYSCPRLLYLCQHFQ